MWKNRIICLVTALCMLATLLPAMLLPVMADNADDTPTVNITSVGINKSKYPGKPQIKWQAVDGAEKYYIYRTTEKDGEFLRAHTTTACSYSNTSAVPGTTYYYKIAAVMPDGTEYVSDTVSATALCAPPKPSYKLVSGTTSDGEAYTGEPKIYWDAVDGAVSYKVYRADTISGDYELRTTTKKCGYTNRAAKHGRVYYYKVAAVDSAGNLNYSAPIKVAVKCDAPELSIKRANGINSDGDPYVGKPMLEWLVVDGADSYKIYRSTSKDGTYKRIYTTSKTYFINTSAEAGTKYYYKVKAVGKDSATSSSYSKIKYTTTTAATPKSKIPAKKYSITVNYKTNTVNVYTYDKDGKYSVPVKAMICSTGDATPHSGKYSLANTNKWKWQPLFGNVNGYYVTQITGNILFHSVPYTSYGVSSSLEYWEFDKLGTAASMGCVRLQVKDARWIYSHKSDIKAVRFYSSSTPGPLGQPVAPKISGNKTCRGWDPSDKNSDNPWLNAKIKAGNYVGMQADKAVIAAGERGFTVERIAYKHSEKPEGTVIAQSIKSGTKAAMNAKLTLTVSAG